MRLFHTATILITWSMADCIIHMETIATTTVLCPLYRIEGYESELSAAGET